MLRVACWVACDSAFLLSEPMIRAESAISSDPGAELCACPGVKSDLLNTILIIFLRLKNSLPV